MSTWSDLEVEQTVLAILADRNPQPEDHHFGRPYMTAYQLAIEVQRDRPEILEALGHQVGGLGRGANSFARYLARQLSGEIRRAGGVHPIEGAFLWSDDTSEHTFRDLDRSDVEASAVKTSNDLSMFRLR